MSYKDLVVCAGSTVSANTGVLAIPNSNISASDVVLASFSTAVGTASAAVQLRCVAAAGSATITAVDAAGAAVAAVVGIDYLVLRTSNAGLVSA